MKKTSILSLALVLCSICCAAQPSYDFSFLLSSANILNNASITSDGAGNIYISGHVVNSTVDLDPGPGTYNVSAASFRKVYFAKYDASGNFIWGNQVFATTNDDCYSKSIKIKNNYLYLAATLGGTVDFDPGPGSDIKSCYGGGEACVLKFDLNGNYIWGVLNGGAYSSPTDIEIDNTGAVYMAAYIHSTCPNTSYVKKFNSSGTLKWTQLLSTSGTGCVNGLNVAAIAIDNAGGIYLTGHCNLPSGFGGAGLIYPVICGSAYYDTQFFVKLDTAGTMIFRHFGVHRFYCTSLEQGSYFHDNNYCNIDFDTINNQVALTGYFLSTQDFDFGPGTYNLTTSGANVDRYIAKYTPSGGFVWAVNFNTNGAGNVSTHNSMIDFDENGNTYYLGMLSAATADMHPGASNPINTRIGTAYNIIVAKYDNLGNIIWSQNIGDAANTYLYCYAMHVSPGYFYLYGGFTASSVDFDMTAGTVNLSGTGGKSFIIRYGICSVAPVQPSTISGATTVCNGSANVYSITPISGASSYTWTLPGGWTGTSTTNSINATAGASGGTISVTANNACGSSTAQTLNITVNTPPSTPSAIVGSNAVCSGSNQTYSVTNDPAATSYIWSLPGTWSGSSTTNSINATAGATGGTISVTANNACGSSTTQTLNVIVNTPPAQPSSITGSASVCEGTSQPYSVTNDVTATSYTWTLPATWSGSSTTNSINSTAGTSGGTISVSANNSCGSSTAQTLNVTVNPQPTIGISGGGAVCENDNVCLTATGGFTYFWINGNCLVNPPAAVQCITMAAGCGGMYEVVGTDMNGCSDTSSVSVTINSLPTVTLSLNATSVCVDNAVFAFSGGSPAGGTFSGTGVTAGNFNAATAGVGTHIITYTFTDGNGCTNTNTDQITVNNCTDISDLGSGISDVVIYPNPFTNEITISGNFNGSVGVTILNPLGEIVFSGPLTSNHKLQTTNLHAGMYFLQIKNENTSIIKKIVKE